MSREFADQLVALASEPERRYSSDELLALAAVHDKGFHRRTLSDWPKWGLLALSSPSGRETGGGVERTWTAPQVQVFLMVVRKRLRTTGVASNSPTFQCFCGCCSAPSTCLMNRFDGPSPPGRRPHEGSHPMAPLATTTTPCCVALAFRNSSEDKAPSPGERCTHGPRQPRPLMT